jgi:hypothetical protein
MRRAAAPFDVETVTLRMRTDAVALALNNGATDQLDVTAVLPVVRLSLLASVSTLVAVRSCCKHLVGYCVRNR